MPTLVEVAALVAVPAPDSAALVATPAPDWAALVAAPAALVAAPAALVATEPGLAVELLLPPQAASAATGASTAAITDRRLLSDCCTRGPFPHAGREATRSGGHAIPSSAQRCHDVASGAVRNLLVIRGGHCRCGRLVDAQDSARLAVAKVSPR